MNTVPRRYDSIRRGGRGSATVVAALLLLLTHHSLLLTLHLFKACHESALLLRLLGILCHGAAHVFLLDHETEGVGLHDCDREREEVVVGKSGSIVVEEDHEHDGHQIHHPFHAWHLTGGVLHVDTRIDDVGDGHEKTEEGDVVAEIFGHERDVAAP